MLPRLRLLPFLALLLSFPAAAQFNYSFSVASAPYTPLTSATPLTGNAPWQDRNFVAPMPFSWKMDTVTLNSLPLFLQLGPTCADTASFQDVNGFLFADFTEITDRGRMGSASLSPIRYTTTGTAPSRIFKLEMANAGFGFEAFMLNTLDDYINVQIWIYEGSNIVELRYGASRTISSSIYFTSGTSKPIIGYVKHLDLSSGHNSAIYSLKGDAATATLDSIQLNAASIDSNSLNAWPDSGRVFRFTPTGAGTVVTCAPPEASFTAGTPYGNTVAYLYTGTGTGLDSLVWDFGDNTRQAIAGAYSAPVFHTYAAPGQYDVSVKASNSCGVSTAVSARSTVAVNPVAGMAEVMVYPNPASSTLIVDAPGMEGGTATILSVIGQVMARANLTTKTSLPVAALPAGAYTLLLRGKDGTVRFVPFAKQ